MRRYGSADYGTGDPGLCSADGFQVSFKPARRRLKRQGRTTFTLMMMREELGPPKRGRHFRFGASTLLADIERQLEHYLTRAYANVDHMPKS